MQYLAFDQSLSNSGWSLIKEDKSNFELVSYGVIKTNNKTTFIERLIYIENELEKLVNSIKPDYVFLEEVYCPRNSPYAWPQLLVVESVYKIWLTKNNKNFLSFSSKKTSNNSWRKLLNITSSHKKATKLLLSNLKINEHIADSIAINLAGIITTSNLNINPIMLINMINK